MKLYIYVIGFIVLAVTGSVVLLLAWPSPWPAETNFGVTFSARQARGLGLNAREAYLAVLDELQVKQLRLIAYWDDIEPVEKQFQWDELDWQMNEATRHGARVILTVGRKVPRWPECHVPAWTANISEEAQQQNVLTMLTAVVARYKNHPALRAWQLENEPLFDFGVCPPPDPDFLRREENLIRAADGSRPILITDSGELSSWRQSSRYGDIFGTTMYRTVFSARKQKQFHYDYIFPAWLYRAKARLVKLIRGKDVIISELQGEPWGARSFTQMSEEDRLASFSPARFRDLHKFAERTQLSEAYWWGVEYWYWEKGSNQNPVYWDMAREMFGNL